MGIEPTIMVRFTQRGALLVRYALKAFVGHELVSDEDRTAYQLLIDAVKWPGPEERTVEVTGLPHVPKAFTDPRWRQAYMAGYKAKRHAEKALCP